MASDERNESNTHGQGPADPHPGTHPGTRPSPRELHEQLEQHVGATMEQVMRPLKARPHKARPSNGLGMLLVTTETGVREPTAAELLAHLERHGFAAVRGEEAEDAARALRDYYQDQRERAAAVAAKFAHELEDGGAISRLPAALAELKRHVEKVERAMERELYHDHVASGRVTYAAPDDAE